MHTLAEVRLGVVNYFCVKIVTANSVFAILRLKILLYGQPRNSFNRLILITDRHQLSTTTLTNVAKCYSQKCYATESRNPI